MWTSSPFSNDSKSRRHSRHSKTSKSMEITVKNLDEDSDQHPAGQGSFAMDSLLRLFRSDFFDAFMAVTYLYRYREARGVNDYLCNELYVLSDADLEAFMPQLCNLLVHHGQNSPGLERFVMDKCASSMHFAIQVFWFLQAAVEDAVRENNKKREARCKLLKTQCETAAVNGSQHAIRVALSAHLPPVPQNSKSPVRRLRSVPEELINFQGSPASLESNGAPYAPSRDKAQEQPRLPDTTDQSESFDFQGVPVMSSDELSALESMDVEEKDIDMSTASSKDQKRNGDVCEIADDVSVRNGSEEGNQRGLNDAGEGNENITIQQENYKSNSDALRDEVSDLPQENKQRTGENVNRDETANDSRNVNYTQIEDEAKQGDELQIENEIQKVNDVKKADNMPHVSRNIADLSAENMVNTHESNCEISPTVTRAELVDAFASEPVSDSTLDNGTNPRDEHAEEPKREQNRPAVSLPSTWMSNNEINEQKGLSCNLQEEKSAMKRIREDAGALLSLDMDPETLIRMKQERFDYFQDSLAITKSLVQLSLSTREKPDSERKTHLLHGLQSVNEMLLRRMSGDSAIPLVVGTPAPSADVVAKLGLPAALRSIHLALTRANSQVLRILRVHEDESVLLTSRTRVPYMLFIEVLPTPMTCSDRLLFCEHIAVAHSPDPQQNKLRATSCSDVGIPSSWNMSSGGSVEKSILSSAEKPKRKRKLSEMTPRELQRANVRATIYGDAHSDQPYEFGKADKVDNLGVAGDELKSRQAALFAVFGELWSEKEERILKNSPFSGLKDTRLMSFIVKAGDDLRQEQLAIQLIKQFQAIFREEDVDVFLRPFTVMSVSSDAGLVEVMPDSVSVCSLKARTPNFVSLLDYFERAYGHKDSQSFRAAQRRFIRSMAGYSLITYFLQIKDRHNGNIMLDARGHVVHIDFGFMLTNSPGAIKFENAPFKLTEEYLQVICAMKNVTDISKTSKTEGFRYFQELFVLGLLAARKHHEKITTLVRIMLKGTRMPCMAAGHSVIDSLEHRFLLGMPEKQCVNHAISLIESSRLSWRSVVYDSFQEYSNGIV